MIDDPLFKIHVGKWGEDIARSYLESHNYRFLCSNYRTEWGEIDLAFRERNRNPHILVFVEVKTRFADHEEDWGPPQLAVNDSKKRRLLRTAYHYLEEIHDMHVPRRFDIMEVLYRPGELPVCKHLKGVF